MPLQWTHCTRRASEPRCSVWIERVVDAGFERRLHRLADQPFGAGEIEAQAHMRGGERLPQARQGGVRSTGLRSSGAGFSACSAADVSVAGRARDEDDLGAGEEAFGCCLREVEDRRGAFGVGDEEMVLARLGRRAFRRRAGS